MLLARIYEHKFCDFDKALELSYASLNMVEDQATKCTEVRFTSINSLSSDRTLILVVHNTF
jgi:hypothetical protein